MTPPFLKVSVFISVFGRFRVDDRRKRIKNYAFSSKKLNGLALPGTQTFVYVLLEKQQQQQ